MREDFTDPLVQHMAQARARREEMRSTKMFGEAMEVKCWLDEPEQCSNLPIFQIYQLDGSYYYTCREHATELVENLPDIPLGKDTLDAKIH